MMVFHKRALLSVLASLMLAGDGGAHAQSRVRGMALPERFLLKEAGGPGPVDPVAKKEGKPAAKGEC